MIVMNIKSINDTEFSRAHADMSTASTTYFVTVLLLGIIGGIWLLLETQLIGLLVLEIIVVFLLMPLMMQESAYKEAAYRKYLTGLNRNDLKMAIQDKEIHKIDYDSAIEINKFLGISNA